MKRAKANSKLQKVEIAIKRFQKLHSELTITRT